MLFLGRLTAINHSYFEKLSSIVRVDASYVLVCFGPGRASGRDRASNSGLLRPLLNTYRFPYSLSVEKYIASY